MASLIFSLPFLTLPVKADQLVCPTAETPEGRVWNLINCYGWDLDIETKKEILETIRCESGFDPTATGDHGNSHGLVQIHHPSWPEIPVENAENPVYAVNFIVNEFRVNNKKIWTCWRKHYDPTYGQGNS